MFNHDTPRMNVIISTKEQDEIMKSMELAIDVKTRAAGLSVARNILSTELVKFILGMTAGTNFSANLLADKVLDLNILEIVLGEPASNSRILYNIIYNELFKISLECSSITSKDYAAFFNKNIQTINHACNVVCTILNNVRAK
jgi:hypothetical protein